MKKSERLSEMMILLNKKDSFNLKELMQRYNISKSTAIRDVQSLEQIGMPIYAEYGRNGCYKILKNRLLSPIIFTVDEMYSLYFAMLTLNNYQSTPFHLDLTKLKHKFESCITDEQILMLNKMEKTLSLTSYKHPNSCPFLKEILELALVDSVCNITYQRNGIIFKYVVHFLNISSSYGQWYVTSYNYETKRIQVFRCDKIIELSKNTSIEPVLFNEVKSSSKNIYRQKDAIDFEVFVTTKGVDLFHKENYPSMKLELNDNKPYIKGFYNIGEEHFIANYFLNYGCEILKIHPPLLKNLIIEKALSNLKYFETV